MKQKKGIALLVTLFFIMLITVSIGVGFTYIHEASKSVKQEQILLQDSMIVNDVVQILKNSPQLQDINSSEDFSLFLSQSSVIPLKSHGFDIVIHLKSARSKINPNMLKDTNGTKKRMDSFKIFLQNHMINPQYADMMADLLNGEKANNGYLTDIFEEHPELYRDGIVSYEQLDELGDIYKQKFHTNDIDKVDMQELFYISQDTNYKVDANFASALTWQLLLGCSQERANQLVSGGSAYATMEDLNAQLNDDEKKLVKAFNVSVNEEILYVTIEVSNKNKQSFIGFEYNIKTKMESNFVLKI